MVTKSRKAENEARGVALLVAGLLLTLGSAGPASAAVYGTEVLDEDSGTPGINGTRTVEDGELVPTDSNFWQDASLSWTITQDGSTFTYEYTFEGFAGPGSENPDISHAVFDLTDDAVNGGSGSDPVTDVRIDGNLVGSDLQFGDFDGIAGAFKIDQEFAGNPTTVTFESQREPVWGDLFLKSGQTDLTNRDFGVRNGGEAEGFIARPNGVIPLPAAVWSGLLLLGGGALACRCRPGGGRTAS